MAWTNAKASLEAGVKKSLMIEAAVLGHVDDFGFRVAKERDGFEQADLHLERPDGMIEMLLKKPVQMSAAATALHCKLFNRKAQQLVHRKAFNNPQPVVFGGRLAGAPGVRQGELCAQKLCDDAEQLCPMQ